MRTLLIVLWTVPLAAPQDLRNPHNAPQDVAAGAKSFRSHCAPCHGLHAEGGRGPNLAAGRFYRGSSDADLLRNISDGIPGTEMPGIFYMEDRVWQIVAYIRSLNAAAEKPAGDAAGGAALFRSKGCMTCHRVSGEGGRLGPDLTQIGKTRSLEYLRRSILDPDADVPQQYRVVSFLDASGNRVQGFVMNEDTYSVQLIDMSERLHSYQKSTLNDYRIDETSKMPQYRDSLNGGQLNDLVAYLASLRPE